MPVFISHKKLETYISLQATEACDHIISEMGAELHDDLIQKLSVFRLYIDRIERSCADKTEVETIAVKMQSDFEQVIHVVRSISKRFFPTRVEGETLMNTLEMLCQNMEAPGTGHIHFESRGTPKSFADKIEVYLFRIVQELIHNAFKHSAAWHIWVRLIWEPNKLTIEVEDDGSGFTKISQLIDRLNKKYNSLKMRTQTIGASITYERAYNGLLAKIEYRF